MLLFLVLPPILFTAGPAERPRIEILTESARALVPSFYATCDPAPSFDARRVLFSGKRAAGDSWQVFELEVATGKTRQLTTGPHDSRWPAYQSGIFTLDAPTPWDQAVFVRQGNLHTCTLEGKDCHQITFHPAGEEAGPPAVAWDGRVIYPLRANGKTRLFAVNLDGTDVALFSNETVDFERAAPGEDQIYFAAGGLLKSLSMLRPSLGAKAAAANGAEPETLPGGGLLARTGQTLVRIDAATGVARAIYRSAGAVRQPRALVRRPLPDGRGSVVDPAEPAGVLYCLSAHTSDRPDDARARYVRVHIPGRAPATIELGQDGSFHVRLPANTPVSVETLDEARRPLRRSAPFWVRNKENRGCIGCHEDPELTPENRFAEALRRKAVDLTRTAP